MRPLSVLSRRAQVTFESALSLEKDELNLFSRRFVETEEALESTKQHRLRGSRRSSAD
jgi:hypothetical protein